MNLGERIYQLRTKQELSQNDLAEMLHVSRQSVSKWENNNAVPDLEKAVKLSEIFGVSLDELVKGEGAIAEESWGVRKNTETPIKGNIQSTGTPLRKIAGVILLCLALFIGALILFGTGSILSCWIIMSPFLLCGIACLKAERYLGVWCGWAIYFSVDMYLRYGTICDWTQVFYDGPPMGSGQWIIVWSQFLGMIAMIIWTGINLRQTHPSKRDELGRVCGLSWGVFVLALLFVKFGNMIVNRMLSQEIGLANYLAARYCFGLLDWVRIAAFTLALVSTVRYFYEKGRKRIA